jgi:methionyl-tRNA formyltransferase
MIKSKKNICLLIDQSGEAAYEMCKCLFNSKYFKFSLVIFRNKNINNINKFKKFLDKDTTVIVSSFIQKNKKVPFFFKKNKIDLAICLAWHNKIKKTFLNYFSDGIVNFHPSPIPLNRGCHSTFWGIYNDTNHGATMHFMDTNFDWGKILDRSIFQNKDSHTAEHVFRESRNIGLKLLKKNLKNLRDGNFKSYKNFTKKDLKKSKYHKKTDIHKVTNLNVNQSIKISTLWNLIKATKFKENGYYIKSGKNKYFIKSTINKLN